MQELAQHALYIVTARAVSRFGLIGDQEVVTIAKLPKRGAHASLVGRPDMRTTPTPDLLTGLFVVQSRRQGKFTLINRDTRVLLSGVPRRSIRKIIDF